MSSRLPWSAVRFTGAARKPPVADVPGLDPGNVAEVEDQETRLAPVQEAEPVAALLHRLNGQVFPLTMIVFPKNSGFQMGENSPSGM